MNRTALNEAIDLTERYTNGTFDLWLLSGKRNASVRACILASLRGVDRVTQAQAGITALRTEFYEILKIEGPHMAGREKAFIDLLKRV